MGSLRRDGVELRVYPKDHAGALIPHVHAIFDRGDVPIALYDDRSVGISTAHNPDRYRRVKKNEIVKALRAAANAYDALIAEWEAMNPRG
jgi:hypothetical protein